MVLNTMEGGEPGPGNDAGDSEAHLWPSERMLLKKINSDEGSRISERLDAMNDTSQAGKILWLNFWPF